ncbi:MAG: hypothetical protein AVDCRST_MAG18-747, partial [uncultured Thermomicrobiales bacterium]
ASPPLRFLRADLRRAGPPAVPHAELCRARYGRDDGSGPACRGGRLRLALGGRPPHARAGPGDPRGVDHGRRARRRDDARAARPDPPDALLPPPGPRRQDGGDDRPAQSRAVHLFPRLRQPARRVPGLWPPLERRHRGARRADGRRAGGHPGALVLARPGQLRRPPLSPARRHLQPAARAGAAPADLVRGGEPGHAPRVRAIRAGLEHDPRLGRAGTRAPGRPRGGVHGRGSPRRGAREEPGDPGPRGARPSGRAHSPARDRRRRSRRACPGPGAGGLPGGRNRRDPDGRAPDEPDRDARGGGRAGARVRRRGDRSLHALVPGRAERGGAGLVRPRGVPGLPV